MIGLIRKLHIYAGLLTFSQLVVYGIAGLVATVQSGAERAKTPHSVYYVPFVVPPNSADKDIAALVYRTLNFPITRPVPDWYLQHTADHHLLLDFYNINGIHRVMVLEEEHRLRVEEIRNSTGLFLEDIHAATPEDENTPPLVRAWAVWNEVAMWTLLGFCASGIWLWLASRASDTWAWVSLGAGTGSMAALWWAFR